MASVSITLPHKIPDLGVRFLQHFFLGQEDNPEVLAPGALPETGTVDHQNVLLKKKVLDEDLVAFRNVDARKSV